MPGPQRVAGEVKVVDARLTRAGQKVIPGGAELVVPLPDEHQESGFGASGLVFFRDLAGVRRRRWESGTLNELDEYDQEIRSSHR